MLGTVPLAVVASEGQDGRILGEWTFTEWNSEPPATICRKCRREHSFHTRHVSVSIQAYREASPSLERCPQEVLASWDPRPPETKQSNEHPKPLTSLALIDATTAPSIAPPLAAARPFHQTSSTSPPTPSTSLISSITISTSFSKSTFREEGTINNINIFDIIIINSSITGKDNFDRMRNM